MATIGIDQLCMKHQLFDYQAAVAGELLLSGVWDAA